MPEILTSRDNERIKYYIKLVSQASARKESGLFAAEGARLCLDAALSGIGIREFFCTGEAQRKHADTCRLLINKAQKAYIISDILSQKMSDTKSPQGIFCMCETGGLTVNPGELTGSEHIVVLESISDPANLGSILRSAEAFGYDAVLMSEDCADMYNSKVLRGSMGAVFRVKTHKTGDFPALLELLASKGFKTLAAVPYSDADDIRNIDTSLRPVPVIGNEGNGLTQDTINACEGRVTIPMAGNAESLNAGVAAGILMWYLR